MLDNEEYKNIGYLKTINPYLKIENGIAYIGDQILCTQEELRNLDPQEYYEMTQLINYNLTDNLPYLIYGLAHVGFVYNEKNYVLKEQSAILDSYRINNQIEALDRQKTSLENLRNALDALRNKCLEDIANNNANSPLELLWHSDRRQRNFTSFRSRLTS